MIEKISIIVPVYNADRFLPQTIESLLNQTYKNIELILVDDGSTDDSLAVCKRYENDSRVLVIHQENRGRSCARNTGIAHASGRFIGFMDDDDVAHPRMFELLHSALKRTKCDISMCQMLYGGGGFDAETCPSILQLNGREFYKRFFGRSEHAFEYRVIWNKLYRNIGNNSFAFRSDVHGEDIDFLIRNRACITKVAYIDTPLIFYRVRNDSLSHSSPSLAKIIEDDITFLSYFSADEEVTPLFMQKAWMEIFSVLYQSQHTAEADKVRNLYLEWRMACKESRMNISLAFWKRILIKIIASYPHLYRFYLYLRNKRMLSF